MSGLEIGADWTALKAMGEPEPELPPDENPFVAAHDGTCPCCGGPAELEPHPTRPDTVRYRHRPTA